MTPWSPPFLSTKLIVPGSTASLKVAVTLLAIGTPVAPEAGDCADAVVAVVSAVAVVNDQEVEVIVLPDRSWAPLKVAV